MCGIVGYVGKKQNIVDMLLQLLKRLEYRGYDSAGITVLAEGLITKKKKGKIRALESVLGPMLGTLSGIGIAHTRWATHGDPSDENAHPFEGCENNGVGTISVVHNGIIENYAVLKKELLRRGHTFTSETDSEVIVHLIEEFMEQGKGFYESVRLALSQLTGAYAILVMSAQDPNGIVAARKGSPLRIGVLEQKAGYVVASDAVAFAHLTQRVVEIMDQEIVWLTAEGFSIGSVINPGAHVERDATLLEWDATQADKGPYDSFMEAEIHEQPMAIENALRGRIVLTEAEARVHLGGVIDYLDELRRAKRIIAVACGSSWHVCIVAQYLIEHLARVPVRVEYASEFRYRSPIIEEGTVVLVISQSGETADTLAALREAKRFGVPVMGICNAVGSSIARETDFGVYTHTGPEIGVASTKAFIAQMTVIELLAILLAQLRGQIPDERVRGLLTALKKMPEAVSRMLEPGFREQIRVIANAYASCNNFMYLGRGINFPVALEGALKLKEISYVHAEGYPAAEIKHGPIALIDHQCPSVGVVLKNDPLYDKVMSNLKEIGSRTGPVIVIACEGDDEIDGPENGFIKHIIRVPEVPMELSPLVTTIPMQLLAFEIALLRECDVDMPRNLAKSVTVE